MRMSESMFVLMTDCAGLLACVCICRGSQDRTSAVGRPPIAEVLQAPGGQTLKWVTALSVGALGNSVLLANAHSITRSNEIFKEHYKSVIFKEIQSELS